MPSIVVRFLAAFGFGLSVFASLAVAGKVVLDFNDNVLNKAPKLMECVLAGKGKPGDWKIRQEAGNKMLAQLGDHDREIRYPVCVSTGFMGADVDVSVRFKPISGDTDRAGGLVWRYLNRNNFYVVRANALEDNVVLYKMHKGRRSSLAPVGTDDYGADADVPKKKWSTLRVAVVGDTFTVFLNGKELYKVRDKTFTKPGRVGVWTKADSVTYFDDLTIITK